MDNRPIGVFDSGVGGLTAVKELQKILPQEDIIYFGDTARVPYGSRSRETIQLYTKQAIQYLSSFGVKAILAACGTVSSNFPQEEYAKLHIQPLYATVVESAATEAVQASQNGKIGVIATSASIRSQAYTLQVNNLEPSYTVIGEACPLLVTLVEQGLVQKDHPVTRSTLEMYLQPIKEAGCDTLILGCTHFPLLSEGIREILGNQVTLIDSGATAARQLKRSFSQQQLLATRSQGKVNYFVTDTVEQFVEVAKIFLKEDIASQIQYVDVHKIENDFL